jgi:25S rRNA (adenine2142-N1)-methyltransferase
MVNSKRKKNNGKPIPLAPPPMKSRKRARIVTTLFHKHTRERDEALQAGNKEEVARQEQKIEDMGGREEYQRASQLNTSIFSTSKWVLSVLHKQEWLPQGISVDNTNDSDEKIDDKKTPERRSIRLLEVGAINTQLLDAADNPKCALNVRAIDIQSSQEERIEEQDFLDLELLDSVDVQKRYDAVVCSMVINCVTTPEDRGKMLFLLKQHLRPGGLCFLTLPLLCLTQSPFMTKELFTKTLRQAVGFDVLETKETPKIAFYVLQRPEADEEDVSYDEALRSIDQRWKRTPFVKRGKKFRNKFCVVFKK